MLPKLASRTAEPGFGATYYQRHRPEQTLFYQIIEQHYPAFTEQLAAHGTALPGYVQREFEDYLKCGRLEHGFLRFLFASRPAIMGRVPGIVYRVIATHLIKKAGFMKKTAQTGAVTLIQRFGSHST